MNLSKLSITISVLFFCSSTFAQYRLVFTGDIMLTREVQREIIEKNYSSPWTQMKPFFLHSDWLVGNFEGAVGNQKDCYSNSTSPCFAVSESILPLIAQAGFNALGIENNHSDDLGTIGRSTTIKELQKNKIVSLTYQDSPQFLKLGDYIIAIVSLNTIEGRGSKKIIIPNDTLQQKLRLAKSLANWVIVYLHWGNELIDWPSSQQKTQAVWLIKNGADVIIGHHPHVIQPPQCILGKPVFYSLGNHIFDQKYPETKQGLIAVCTINNKQLRCNAAQTETPAGSSFPSLQKKNIDNSLSSCIVNTHNYLLMKDYKIKPIALDHHIINGGIKLLIQKNGKSIWNMPTKNLLSLELFKSASPTHSTLLFTLENHFSDIDNHIAPRPYVYAITSHGLEARWRGSALAWPLLDATFIKDVRFGNIDFLCALHRGNSFLLPTLDAHKTRVEVYRWNGFGFNGISDKRLKNKCNKVFNYTG